MTEVDVLNKMKEYLLEHGWTQRAFVDKDNGSVCILGALNRSCPDTGPLWRTIQLELEEELNDSVMAWNDDPERTFNDIMDLLDTMILQGKQTEALYG